MTQGATSNHLVLYRCFFFLGFGDEIYFYMFFILLSSTAYAAICGVGEYLNGDTCVPISDGYYGVECPELPDEYTILEYIQSTGGQYINTGLLVNHYDDYGIEYLLTVSDNTTSRNFMGANAYLQLYSTVLGYSTYDNLSHNVTYYPTGAIDLIKLTYDNENETLYINNVYAETHNWAHYKGTDVTLALFRLGDKNNQMHSGVQGARVKMYSCKISKDSIFVRDFVPARRNSDGVLGMYDVINDIFYTNNGTGTFIAGPEGCFNIKECEVGFYCINGIRYPCTTPHPENSSYLAILGGKDSNCPWECNKGYLKINEDTCRALCSAGATYLRTESGVSVPLFATRNTTPAINIEFKGGICYADLITGNASDEINLEYKGQTYHTVAQ